MKRGILKKPLNNVAANSAVGADAGAPGRFLNCANSKIPDFV
jgi:hypothetical protein